MARREFAVSPWDFRRLGAALTLTEAEIDKLSRYYLLRPELTGSLGWGPRTEELRPTA
jgi:hypothetical protein